MNYDIKWAIEAGTVVLSNVLSLIEMFGYLLLMVIHVVTIPKVFFGECMEYYKYLLN